MNDQAMPLKQEQPAKAYTDSKKEEGGKQGVIPQHRARQALLH